MFQLFQEVTGIILSLKFSFIDLLNLAELFSTIIQLNIQMILNSCKFLCPKINVLFFYQTRESHQSITYNTCTFFTINLNSFPKVSRRMHEEGRSSGCVVAYLEKERVRVSTFFLWMLSYSFL